MNALKQNLDKALDLIEEPKLLFSDLANYLENSPLAGMYDFDLPDPPPEELTPKDIEKVCRSLEKLLLEDLTFDKLIALFVASSRAFLLSSNFQDFECRSELLHKTYRYANTLDPVHLHIAAKRIHENLKSSTNVLFLCKTICFSSDMGNALAMCLAWAMLLETLDKEIEMYCFHPLSYINELLMEVDIKEMLKKRESSMKAYFLFELIAFLVSSIVSRSNEELKAAGYSQYFRCDLKDVQALREWASQLSQQIVICAQNSDTNYDITMAIKETILFSILSPLDDKLDTIDGASEARFSNFVC